MVHTPEPGRSRLLLVEGVPGVGKSTLLDALLRAYVQQHPTGRLRTLLHLTQAHTRDRAYRFWLERPQER